MQTTRVRLPNGKFASKSHHPNAPEAHFNAVGSMKRPVASGRSRKKITSSTVTQHTRTATNQTVRTIFVVDRSGSMSALMGKVGEAVDAQIQKIKSLDTKHGQTTKVSLINFGTEITTNFEDAAPRDVKRFGDYRILARGGTALFAATKKAIQTAEKLHIVTGERGPVVIMVLTDGQNNEYGVSADDLNTLITRVQATDLFTIVFMVPPGYKHEITSRLKSVHEGNIVEWAQSAQGVREVSEAVSVGLASTYTGITRGVTNSKNFFEVTASKLSDKVVRSQLVDISGQIRHLTVEKESPINDFIADKCGSYTRGNAYYQLTKKETIQPSKDILIQKRGETQVFSGPKARELVGITDASKDARIEPGNLGDWIVYVQSQSANRLLVRGTKLVYKL